MELSQCYPFTHGITAPRYSIPGGLQEKAVKTFLKTLNAEEEQK